MDLRFAGILFFVSGLAALGYEIAWISRLELTLGGTTASLGVVLAAYMGGLGLGARLCGRLADRPGPVALRYARLELGIGVLGLLAPWTLDLVETIYAALHGLGGVALKATLAVLALAPATLLMGATLPLVARAGLRDESDAQRTVARLYGMNTLGAVAGVVLTQFLLLEHLGLATTSRAMAALNFLLAAAAMLARSRLGSVAPALAAAPSSAATPVRTVALLAFAAGALGMSLEIALSRALGMALGSTRHGFAVVLVAVLIGIGLGSLWIERVARSGQDMRARVVRTFAAFAGATCLLLWLHPYLLRWVFLLTQSRAFSYPKLLLLQFLVCAAAVLPAALALGALFPWLTRWATGSTDRAGQSIAWVYFCNTVGGVLGSLGAALFLLPWLGTANLLRAIAMAAALCALLAAWRQGLRSGALPLLALLLAAVVPSWDAAQLDFNPTRLRNSGLPKSPGEYEDTYIGGGSALLLAADGRDAYVSVRSSESVLQLKIGGKTDASFPNDMPTQLLLGAVPLLARPQARHVAIVGLGSGVTAAVVAHHPGVERVDVIEIEPLVVAAAREHFRGPNHAVLEHDKVRLHIDDARSWLRVKAAKQSLDVLISEPSNPSIAGIANLFTLEHYRSAAASLRDDGVFLQWVQLYETDEWMLRSMIQTFREVFPEVDLWWAYPSDLLLLGSRSPLRYDRQQAVQACAANPVLSAELWPQLQALDPTELFSRYLAPAEELRLLLQGGEILRDDHPLLATRAARNRYEGAPPFSLLRQLWQHVAKRSDPWPNLTEFARPDDSENERLRVGAARYLEHLSPEIALAYLREASGAEATAMRARLTASARERQRIVTAGLEAHPDHPLLFLELARLHLDAGDPEIAARILDELRLPERWDSGQLAQLRLRAIALQDAASAERVVALVAELLERLPLREDAQAARLFAYGKLVQASPLTPKANELLAELSTRRRHDPELALAFAQAEMQRGRARDALRILDESDRSNHVRFKPEWRRARLLALGLVDLEQAQVELRELLRLFPEQARHPELQQLIALSQVGD